MAVWDLYSKRKRAAEGTADVFSYDIIPQKLRVQVIHILNDAFGDRNEYQSDTNEIWKVLHNGLAREYGTFRLGAEHEGDMQAVGNYFLQTSSTEEALDFIERAFLIVDNHCRNDRFVNWSQPKMTPDEAIAELNTRFIESGVGYELVNGTIIRKDSQIIHKEVILPALRLLADRRFTGANEEYRSAHEHYRSGRNKECLNDCLKAFESTMKSICKIKKWPYNDKSTAKELIETILANDLVPQFLQSEFSSLRTVLESGIPTTRNRLSGHGQGPSPVQVPDYFASYLLGLTASTITLLVNAAE